MKQKRILKIVLTFVTIVIVCFAVVFALYLSQNSDPLVTLNAPTNGGMPSDISKE